MGLLTDLIRDKRAKKRRDEDAAIAAYAQVLSDPNARADAREYAFDELTKHAGVHDEQKRQLQQKLFPQQLQNPAAPSQAPAAPNFSPAPWAKPQAPPTQPQGTQPVALGKRPPAMFLSPQEQETQKLKNLESEESVKRESAMKLERFKSALNEELQLRKDTDQLNFESVLAKQTEAIQKQQLQSWLTDTNAAIDSGPFSDDQKMQYKQQAFEYVYKLGKKPETQTWKTQKVTLKDGSTIPAVEVSPGRFTRLPSAGQTQGADIPPDQIDTIGDKPESLSTEVRDLKAYYASKGMAPPDATRMALADRKKQLDLAAQAKAQAVETPLPTGAHSPGGPSVANPKASQAIEGGAWEYINSGGKNLPYLGFGKAGGQEREKMIARAGEILQDLNLTWADLPAVGASVKADISGLSRVTSMGAMIQQFEGTLSRNMQTAKRLSDAFQRGDIRLYNRVLAAFKTGKGDAEALNLAAQLHGVAREWGKIMQGSVSAAGVQLNEATSADAFFNGMSNGQLLSFMQNVIEPDISNRTAAIEEEKGRLLNNLRDTAKHIGGSGSTPSPNSKSVVDDLVKQYGGH